MTIIDCCISLKMIKKILIVLGVVDMRQLLLKCLKCLKVVFKKKWLTNTKLRTKMCVESATKNTLNIQQFIWSICPTGQNIWDMSEKKLTGRPYSVDLATIYILTLFSWLANNPILWLSNETMTILEVSAK